MLLEKEIKRVLSELVQTDVAKIELGGSTITVQVFDHASKVILATPVYFGGNYIPKSVRNCLKQKAPFDTLHIRTILDADEENFQITLKYIGHLEKITNVKFLDLLEDFSWLADKWREHLDSHDKNDLVHIPI
ncbi:MAG: hypothetical protein K940chlam7_00369 [Chlamydiae bacterium]|nr:hypothetical protein [Chlamydiota bacterium]